MSQFQAEEEHGKRFAVLFDSFKIEDKFKTNHSNVPYVVVKDRDEKRLAAMVESTSTLGASFIKLGQSAVECLAMASSPEEALAIQMGFIRLVPNGILICPTCLVNAILACEETLNVLKDIKEATKQHVPQL